MRDEMPQFDARRVRPFGVNPAPVASHRAYAERLRLPFPLLSDPDLAVARAYGAVRPDGSAIARSVVLVGPDGRVRFSAHGAPGAALVLESLEEMG